MKSRCSQSRVMLAAWCLMLCLGFVIATSLKVTAAPLGETMDKVGACQGEIAACQANCSASGLPPQDAANCRSDCNRNPCQTGQAIKPRPRTSPTPQAGMYARPRGVEGEQPTSSEKEGK